MVTSRCGDKSYLSTRESKSTTKKTRQTLLRTFSKGDTLYLRLEYL